MALSLLTLLGMVAARLVSTAQRAADLRPGVLAAAAGNTWGSILLRADDSLTGMTPGRRAVAEQTAQDFTFMAFAFQPSFSS